MFYIFNFTFLLFVHFRLHCTSVCVFAVLSYDERTYLFTSVTYSIFSWPNWLYLVLPMRSILHSSITLLYPSL